MHFLVGIIAAALVWATPVTILNMANIQELPRNFRKDEPLRISGSGQFSEQSLTVIQNQIGNPQSFVVVDLRQECHGFGDGNAISLFAPRDWGNRGKSDEQVVTEEIAWLKGLQTEESSEVALTWKKTDQSQIYDPQFKSFKFKNTRQEQAVVLDQGGQYCRFFVTDHLRPSVEVVNRFIALVQGLKPGTWVHFHCAAGDGRTTTFMCLFDMMKNAKSVSVEEIIKRQHQLGGIDLFDLDRQKGWKKGPATERAEFLRKFYTYARNNTDGFQTPYAD